MAEVQIVKVTAERKAALKQFLSILTANGDTPFFCPHASDDATLDEIVSPSNKDLYYLLIEGSEVLGYGLLRGWNDGFQIPSLGIAINPTVRKRGLARLLMDFLHFAALRRGARKVRLRVNKENSNAINLYKSLGYVFENDSGNEHYFLGFKQIA